MSAAENGEQKSKSISADHSAAAHLFGEMLSHQSDVEWAAAQQEDPLASAAMRCVETESTDSARAFVLTDIEASQFSIHSSRKNIS